MKKPGWALAILIVMGGVLGGVLSEGLKAWMPDGPVQTIFLASVPLAIDPPVTLHLVYFTITLGIIFNINLLMVLGASLGLYLYKNL